MTRSWRNCVDREPGRVHGAEAWSDYEAINTVYMARFAHVFPLPARATVGVAAIGADCACELEAIALAVGS